jgi:hypothetical protein
MTGRDSKEYNDLFYLCSLIDYIARKTQNHRSVVVDALGHQRLQHILDLADVYHCDNIDRVSDELIEECSIPEGEFDNIGACVYSIPSYWDIGKVYKRLIRMVAEHDQTDLISALETVYHSWICEYLDDYNGSFYYENPQFIFECYELGEIA